MRIQSENAAVYAVSNDDDAVIARAIEIINRRFARGALLDSPEKASDFVKLTIGAEKHERFLVIFLDTRHRVIASEVLFNGTIDGASIYPRVVVEAALRHNAAAVIFAHNHPSGSPEASHADIRITERLKEALGLIDVRILDHLIVGESVNSMAASGLL